MVKEFEKRTNSKPKFIARLKGIIRSHNNSDEIIEIIIFRGVSSCTTHPTNFDLEEEIIPDNAVFLEGEILQGPMHPEKEIILVSKIKPEDLLRHKIWNQ